MPIRWDEEAPRLARLARLRLAPEEAAQLATACDAITQEFAQLAEFARGLPEPSEAEAAPLRDDVAAPASPDEVEAILAAAGKVDAATRSVIVPRGLP